MPASPSGGPVSVAVINMKGGVGKSTIATLLARHAFRRLGLKALAVDLDPQANMSQSLMGRKYREFLEARAPSIEEIFSGYRPPSAATASPSRLRAEDVVFGQTGSRENSLNLVPSRFDFANRLGGAIETDPRALSRWISENFQDMDLIIVDCSPAESIFTQAAYHASRYVLIPVRPEYFATIGFPMMAQSLEKFRGDNRGHAIDVIGVVINNAFYDGRNKGGPEKRDAMQDIREEAAKNSWHIFRNEIPHSRGFPKIIRGNYSYSGKSIDGFNAFAGEFFDRLEIDTEDER